jgi:hypothetical protein
MDRAVGRKFKEYMSASKLDTPSHEEIAARAEEIYRQSGCVPGKDLENWVRAENELKQRLESNGATATSKEKTATKATKAANGARREKQRV